MHDIAHDARGMTGASRFEAYSRRKQAMACAAALPGFRTVFDAAARAGSEKAGRGAEAGVRFEHLLIDDR